MRFEQLAAHLAELEPVDPSPHEPIQVAPEVPSITVTHFSTNDPLRPASVEIGPINGEPWLLPKAHQRAWETVTALKRAQIETWWATSQWASLHLSAVAMTGVTRPSSSRDGRDLRVEAALEPSEAAAATPEVAALTALQAALTRAAQRAKIPPLTLT